MNRNTQEKPNALSQNLPGVLLAVLFFGAYLTIGLKLNIPGSDTVDNFLDADNYSWILRIADPGGHTLEMRGPHPFAYLIFRPLGWFLNLFTHNPTLSAVLLNALAGSLCVLLAWLFIRQCTPNKTYAALVSSLLGLSASQIFFAAVVESYIFSAAALIGVYLLLQSRKTDTAIIGLSVLTFGITLTNIIQTFIGYVISRPRWREILKYTLFVSVITILLSIVHASIYPSAKLFFLPSGAQAEDEFFINIFQEPAWRALGRIQLLARTMLLYTIVAPKPFVFTTEVGGTFPRFNFFKISPETFSFSSYDGAGTLIVFIWVVMLLAAGLIYLHDLWRTRKADLRTAFVLCLLFNFTLHLFYGYELFLYSADWAYALILFTGISLGRFAENRFFQAGFAVFLVLLAFNQAQFFKFIIQTISPFIQ